ncbi:retrovirus-related pol polyprotein from transposon TNT 1-94, partial [Tanacetum coccineum]
HSLVRGLPKLKFEKDHLCSACAMGKIKKKPYKPKSEDTNQEKLYLLHMDLCVPMRVASINGKNYILVIVEDYSRFTWVKCLRSKDEAPDFVIKFLKMIQNVGIFYETAVARSLQQNGVVERQAVATACYTQNRSIICLRHGKTPYDLLHDKLPDLSFFHVFGALCYPTNNSENLGKLQPKADIGLMPNPPPSTLFVPPSRTDWDLLFQPLFDELLNHPSSVDHPTPEVIAPIVEAVALEPLLQPNHNLDVAHMNNDPLFGILIPENDSEASSSSDVIPTIVHTASPNSEYVTKWTKDHPLDNIISELERPVSTRL